MYGESKVPDGLSLKEGERLVQKYYKAKIECEAMTLKSGNEIDFGTKQKENN